MTILEDANANIVSDEISTVSTIEKLGTDQVLKKLSKGQAIIMTRSDCKPVGIGSIFRTKINVNLGTSSTAINIEKELAKAQIAQKFGADTISDLSMGGPIDEIRKKILAITEVPITTVPIYQAVIEANSITDVSDDLILKVIEKQLTDGISSIVIHAAFSLNDLTRMKGTRIMGMVSKGGSFTASIMNANKIENPFYKNFEYILELLRDKDIVLNLGNAMRSGCIHDTVDEFQLSEILTNSKLARRANEFGVQVILEGLGGHIVARDLINWIQIHKKLTENRPLFVSGPLPTDIALGYDHIAAAVGGAFASGFGADYLCTITPAEHLCLPSPDDIKNGLIACRIAAHVGDSMKFGLTPLFEEDLALAKNRILKNWGGQFQHCIDPEEPQKKHPANEEGCTMCGKHCALSISKNLLM